MEGTAAMMVDSAANAFEVDSSKTTSMTSSSNKSSSSSTVPRNPVMINDDEVMEDALAEEADMTTASTSASAGNDKATGTLSTDLFEEAQSFDELLTTKSVAVTNHDNQDGSNNDDRKSNQDNDIEVEDAMVIDTAAGAPTSNSSMTGYATLGV